MEIMDEYKLEVFKDCFDSGEIRKFRELMMYYECAMLEVKTKLDVLNKELALNRALTRAPSLPHTQQGHSIFSQP